MSCALNIIEHFLCFVLTAPMVSKSNTLQQCLHAFTLPYLV